MPVQEESLLGIIIIIGLMIALLRLLENIGADQLLLRPVANLFRGPGMAYWGTGVIKGVISSFVWPTPATMMVGPMMIPIALRAGLPIIGIAMTMNLFGHGIDLSGDFVIQGAPKLTSSAAGVPIVDILKASIPLVITTGLVATVLGYFLLRKDMKKGGFPLPGSSSWARQMSRHKFSARAPLVICSISRNFIPVIAGLGAATIVAVILM